MNKPLQISLLLNALLAGCLIFLWTTRTANVNTPVAPVAPVATPITIPAANLSDPPPAKPIAFRWSRLYSTNYHAYVKNLRACGCPEPTVRAIVTADVDSVYQVIADRLEKQLAALSKDPLAGQLKSADSESAMRAALQKLPGEEQAKIADLLGLKPPPAPANGPASSLVANAGATPASQNVPSPPTPLVMQNIDVSALKLTTDQTRQLDQIKQAYLQQTAQAGQNPADPANQAILQTAQSDADNMLLIMLGNELYTEYEIAAHQRLLEQIEASRR